MSLVLTMLICTFYIWALRGNVSSRQLRTSTFRTFFGHNFILLVGLNWFPSGVVQTLSYHAMDVMTVHLVYER